MKTSPLQLKHYVLTRLHIEPREEPSINPTDPASLELPDWEGVNLRSKIDFAWADGEAEPRSFAMRLRLTVPNETGKPIPYSLDVETVGYFEISEAIEIKDRENIGKVNGASMLYGICREVFFSLTARFPQVPIILPSMNFFDLKTAPDSSGESAKRQ